MSSVHALSSDEEFLLELVLVGVAEGHTGERSTSSRVVDDLSDNTLDVSLLLGVVESSVLGGALAGSGYGLEDAAVTLTLTWRPGERGVRISSITLETWQEHTSDNSTHGSKSEKKGPDAANFPLLSIPNENFLTFFYHLAKNA